MPTNHPVPPSAEHARSLLEKRRTRRIAPFLIAMLLLIESSLVLAVDEDREGSVLTDSVEKKEPPPLDTDASPSLGIQIAPDLFLGARLQFSVLRRENRDLAEEIEDDQTRLETLIDLAAQALPGEGLALFGEARLSRRRLSGDGEGLILEESKIRLRRAYLLWSGFPIASADLQIGRQRFSDSREWLYDENLDAVRMRVKGDLLDLELSVSTNLLDPEEPEDEMRNYILYATTRPGQKEKVSLYGIARRDRSEAGRDPTFLGISWRGRSIENQRYWLEAASVSGQDGSQALRGYGFDLGWTSRFDSPIEPSFTIGYAFGSGDPNPDDRIDRNFQQTGLQDNQAKFNGVVKFNYYGELFDPELSNIMIGTASVGIIPYSKTSIDLVYHYYSQVYAYLERPNVLRDAGVKRRPSGRSRDLGQEVDLILGTKVIRNVQMVLYSGIFMPGKAFPGSENAFFTEFKIQVSF